jgi:ribosomal protein L37E
MLLFVREVSPTMSLCQNCGKMNTPEAVFCRFCGTKFNFQKPLMTSDPFDHSAPRPYSWKTDEFQTQNEARQTLHLDQHQKTAAFDPPAPAYQPASLAYQPNRIAQNFRCPMCMSNYMPRVERRISTAGWITFAVLLVFFFPLFWIGLLIKEDVAVCQSCNTKLN